MRIKRALMACEESQAVAKAYRAHGVEAYSCDILDCSGGKPEWHIKGDVLPLLNGNCRFQTADGKWHEIKGEWDIIIAFPPCTHLALSGARHFAKKRDDGRQREAIDFFGRILMAQCERIVIENPMGIMSGGEYLKKYFPDLAEKYKIPREYTQTIQPWWFAKDENDKENYHEKTTCLWEIGVSKLKIPELTFGPPKRYTTSTGKSFPEWYCISSVRMEGKRQKIRSRTFDGVANAMTQWIYEG